LGKGLPKHQHTTDIYLEGAPEGIIASETANNAVPAAAMIPLLALGIPGEALTAMMLSVFYVHNIIPGPTLFQTRPEFPISIYLCLLIINIIILLFLLLTTNGILHIIRIPSRFLGVMILTLSLIGVFSLRNSFIDCTVAAVFGIFGYILKRVDYPIVPIILGMVLGKIMDDKFRSGLARIDTPLDFINRPISGTIFALIMIVIISHFWTLYRQKSESELIYGSFPFFSNSSATSFMPNCSSFSLLGRPVSTSHPLNL